MRMSDKTYIVIRGIEWLYSRLDDIGYNEPYKPLFKRIWRGDKTVPDELIKQIRGDVVEKEIR